MNIQKIEKQVKLKDNRNHVSNENQISTKRKNKERENNERTRY